MKITILTLFPEMFAPLKTSIIGRAAESGKLAINIVNIRDYSEATASAIDAEIKHLVNTAYERTEALLREHMDKLQEVAQFLFQHEKMSGEEFRTVMEGNASFLPREEAGAPAQIPSEE